VAELMYRHAWDTTMNDTKEIVNKGDQTTTHNNQPAKTQDRLLWHSFRSEARLRLEDGYSPAVLQPF
jgi:hypothetical protein